MNENCFPKLGKIGPKQFQNPGLSLRGKNRTQDRSPNEEKNKNTNTNAHIGSLGHILFSKFFHFVLWLFLDVSNIVQTEQPGRF